jgi:hypothetical protein
MFALAQSFRNRLPWVAGLCMALSGCIFPPFLGSKPVEIPAERRSVEPTLEGRFWIPGGDNADSKFELVTITRHSDRRYHFVAIDETGYREISSEDEFGPITILKTRDAGIDLLLITRKEGTIYSLAFKSRAGTWVLFPFLGSLEGERTAYLSAVLKRHGLSLRDDTDSGVTMIEGTLDAPRLVALFSDPAFVGGLHYDPANASRLFPTGRAVLPAPDDTSAWWKTDYDTQLASVRFAQPGNELVQPPELIGDFLKDGRKVTISRANDGGLLLTYPPVPTLHESWTEHLRLVPLGREGQFIALIESEIGDPPRTPGFSYWLADLAPPGMLTLTPIILATPDFSPAVAAMVKQIRQQAGQQHGIVFAGSTMSGQLNAANLRALYLDPQFQVGLETWQGDPPSSLHFERAPPTADLPGSSPD